MLTRKQFLQIAAGTTAAMAMPGVSRAKVTPAQREAAISRTIAVPFDHSRPRDGTFALEYLLRHPFNPHKPTVFVIGDGQQFFIRKDLAVDWGASFGTAFNVVGLPGRGFAKALQDRLGVPKGNAWIDAYRMLRAQQWTADIDAIRAALLGADGKVRLWGGSGGGLLVHQYLSQYGSNVSHAFTEAAVNGYLEAAYGLDSDHFWRDISAADRKTLSDVLARNPERRDLYVMLFQRQNFFVDLNKLAAARHQLIDEIAAGDEGAIARARKDYQVDAIRTLEESALAAPIRVRLYEFYAPLAGRFGHDSIVRPDLENSAIVAKPLMDLLRRGLIESPTMDFRALHAVQGEITLLAGRRDHTADYRGQIALASHYPSGKLILVDDNHEFDALDSLHGTHHALIQGALMGRDSHAFALASKMIAPLIWREV